MKIEYANEKRTPLKLAHNIDSQPPHPLHPKQPKSRTPAPTRTHHKGGLSSKHPSPRHPPSPVTERANLKVRGGKQSTHRQTTPKQFADPGVNEFQKSPTSGSDRAISTVNNITFHRRMSANSSRHKQY